MPRVRREGADVTYLTQTILDAIRSVGHHIGQTRMLTADGYLRYHVSARDSRTNEKWTVTAPTERSGVRVGVGGWV